MSAACLPRLKKCMTRLPFLILFTVSFIWQTGAQNVSRDPDPRATKLLIDLETKIEQSKAVIYEFTLELNFPDEEPVIQKGTFLQSGDKHNLEIGEYGFVTDGQVSYWVIDKQRKEIQIHDYTAPTDDDLTNPQALLKIYSNENFDYQMIGTGPAGESVIEFKPLRKGSDYIKARLSLSKSNMIEQIELFNRDGSRYVLNINDINLSPRVEQNAFVVDPGKYQGYHVEDLRIE